VLCSTLLQRQAQLRDADPIEGRAGARRHLVEKSIHPAQRLEVGCALFRGESRALDLRGLRAQGLELDQELAALGHHAFQIRDVGEIAERSLGRAQRREALGAPRDLLGG
jgi:hypothetical protein